MKNLNKYNVVQLTLQGLKNRLDIENTLLIQAEQGYNEPAKFSFCPSASAEEIGEFSEEYKLIIPWDYKEFLLMHNGATLFTHPYYGGGIELFSLDHIRQVYIEYDYISMIPEGWFPIGSDNGDTLFINSKDCNDRFSSYLYWTEMLFVDNAVNLNLNFERWFERLILCNGSHFWEWGHETTEGYYRNLQCHIDNLNIIHNMKYTLD